jgi:SagB-type dehydrogenase family enzyme
VNGIPARPRVLPDVVLLSVEDGVLVDGVGRLQMFRGPLAQTVLPELLPFTDGTRTVGELVRAFPDVVPRDIHKALELLAESGLLQTESDETSCVPDCARDLVSFFRRSLAQSGGSVSAYDAYRQLEASRVTIICPKGSFDAGQLSKLLHSVCIASAEVVTIDQFLREPQSEPLMVVALAAAAEDEKQFEVLEAERQRRLFSWLRVELYRQSNVADIGPLFQTGNESCYACFQRVHGTMRRGGGLTGLQLSNLETTWDGFVALEVLSILARIGQSISGREFRRFSLSDLSSRRLNYPRSQQCPVRGNHPSIMSNSGKPLEEKHVFRLHTASVFEEYVGLEARGHMLSSGLEDPAGVGAVNTQHGKTMQNSMHVDLGSAAVDLGLGMPDALDRSWMRLTCALTLDQLGAVLALTAGIREQNGVVAKRWSASAGNLGSTEIYVIVHSVDGLEKGLYFYQPGSHVLALFQKRNAIASNELMRRLLRRTENTLPNALIILTGAFHRLKKKYGMFAYRLLHLDAGTALSQIHMVARTMRLGARVTPLLPDDVVERELSLHSFNEQSTAAVELFARDKAGLFCRRVRQESCDVIVPHSSGANAPETFADLSVNEVTEMLFNESRITEGILEAKRNVSGTIKRATDESVRYRIPLPRPLRKGLSVGDVLKTRRSIRKFGPKAVPIGAVATGLYYSNRADSFEWASRRNVALRFLILARRVDGLPPGVYEYQPRLHELSILRCDMAHEEMASLFVQDDFADAPCVVWIAGDLHQTCTVYGSLGHRRLLLRAGAAGHRFWMAVMGLGLGGSLIAGLVPGAARTLLGLNGFEKASLFAVAIGYE